ncbi:protein of unknown function [Petrocella atlantisensis]|uniref:Uncharacterized protein n=1 Tax=Petrocella atlantisensis TaxID=2173034 RepID=A0A3P7PRY5_9FIRM|nr:protein of unknown function [Petrocella atlantisensis]
MISKGSLFIYQLIFTKVKQYSLLLPYIMFIKVFFFSIFQ